MMQNGTARGREEKALAPSQQIKTCLGLALFVVVLNKGMVAKKLAFYRFIHLHFIHLFIHLFIHFIQLHFQTLNSKHSGPPSMNKSMQSYEKVFHIQELLDLFLTYLSIDDLKKSVLVCRRWKR